MQDTRYVVKNVFYTYHPDFVQDDNAPNGYYTLDTGRWVVEWSVKSFMGNLPQQIMYFSHDCCTEDEAKEFEKKLLHGLDKHYSIVVNDDNAFILGAK